MSLDRKERDRRLRESDILKAAEHVFATKGYHKAAISDIAQEAQYAVGTIYLYFKNKQELYLTLVEKKAQNLISNVKEKVGQVNGAKEKIKVLVEQQLSYFEENEDFFRIYFSERGGLRWTIKDKISRQAVDKFLKYLDYIAGLIKEAQHQGIINKQLEAKRIAYLLASMMNAAVFPWLKEESRQKEKLKGLSTFVLDVFYKGVSVK
jgi:AcrR family transcriptional regulator